MSSKNLIIDKFTELVRSESDFRDNYRKLIMNISDKNIIKVLTEILSDEDRHWAIAKKMLAYLKES